ncbi:MAG: hypothetical protein IKX67_07240 [Bacteroidales bacterium]|nr:hypothetical protein [Bacteroidales bacterium]
MKYRALYKVSVRENGGRGHWCSVGEESHYIEAESQKEAEEKAFEKQFTMYGRTLKFVEPANIVEPQNANSYVR